MNLSEERRSFRPEYPYMLANRRARSNLLHWEKRKQAQNAWSKTRPRDSVKRANRTQLIKRYGLTTKEYDTMWVAQEGCCAICGREEWETGKKSLAIDHNHATQKVRQLLCLGCNIGLGGFQDDPGRLARAIVYLRKHQ